VKAVWNLIVAELIAEVVILCVSVWVAITAHTSTVGIMAAIYGVSMLSGFASLYAVRAAMQGNSFQFPYGTGRLENACAFAYGVLISLCAGRVLVGVGLEVLSGRPLMAPNLALASIPVAMSLVTNTGFLMVMWRMLRRNRHQTPVFDAYYVMYTTSSVRDAVLLFSMFLGAWLGRGGHLSPAVIDRVLCVAVSLYILGRALPHVLRNFRALVDYPLPEATQLKILKVMAKHVMEYETLGRVFNTRRGNVDVVELELGFEASFTLDRFEALQATMQKELAEILPGVEFRVIPRVATGHLGL